MADKTDRFFITGNKQAIPTDYDGGVYPGNSLMRRCRSRDEKGTSIIEAISINLLVLLITPKESKNTMSAFSSLDKV